MIKISFFLTRRSGSTHEEFHRYWTEKHTALLSTPVEGMPKVHRYVQLFPIPADVEGFHMAQYDGVAEIWFDTLQDAKHSFSSRHYEDVIVKDEEKFLDRSKTICLVSHENPVI